MTNTDNIVSVKNLTLEIDGKLILDDINFDLKESETLVLMGKNGSGKTMLLKTMVRLFLPQKGESNLFGKNVYDLNSEEIEMIKRDIGYVFQKSGLFDSLTIAENVTFALRRFEKKTAQELREVATDCLMRSGLRDVEDKIPSELSGGMQKRAGIARAIATNPKLLLMDDPTAGLDPVLTDAIADLILDLRKSMKSTFIVTAHDLKFAAKLADRIGLLVNGKLHGILPANEFMNTEEPTFAQFREGRLEGPIAVID